MPHQITIKPSDHSYPCADDESVLTAAMAAEQGDADAQTLLGALYAAGRGVARDFASAYMWLSLAAAQGTDQARQVLDSIERQMTPQQRDEAQRMAREVGGRQ